MEKQRKATSPKSSMASTGAKSPTRNGGSPPHKKHTTTESQGRRNIIVKGGQDLLPEEAKRRSPTNSQTSPKRSPKHGQSQVQPLSYFRLHTEERAIRRAGFNYQVASKINTMEIIRRFEEKISKVIEEQEIKIMRREMVPKAQLMPVFDKPFFPQRSRRPLTVPKEPSFLKLKCCIGGEFHRHFCYNVKAIK